MKVKVARVFSFYVVKMLNINTIIKLSEILIKKTRYIRRKKIIPLFSTLY